ATIEIWVLKVLAENGQNFSQLAADERVTILLSFRKDDPRLMGSGSAGFSTSGGMMGEGAGGLAFGGAPGAEGLGVFVGAGDGAITGLPGSGAGRMPAPTGGVGAPQTAASNYELLGDLHLRQGHAREAAHAYQSALATGPTLELYTKLAQARLALGEVEG